MINFVFLLCVVGGQGGGTGYTLVLTGSWQVLVYPYGDGGPLPISTIVYLSRTTKCLALTLVHNPYD